MRDLAQPLFSAVLVHRDVLGFIAFDLILRILLGRMMRVTLVFNVFFCESLILPLTYPASEFQVT